MIERLRQNDRKAYADLFDGYFDKLFTFALNMVFREDVANDIVQEVFIAIYEKSILKNYQGSLKAYLYTSVTVATIICGMRRSRIVTWRYTPRRQSTRTTWI